MRIAALLLLAACAHDPSPVAPPTSPVRFQVSNALVAPVTVAIDGTPAVILAPGRSSPLTVPATARTLTWTAAKPTDAAGQPIPDDVGEVRVPVAGIGALLEIDNVIDGQPHITATIVNRTMAPSAIGVFDGLAVSCAAILPPATDDASGVVRIGYYRLGVRTEVRAYRDGAQCAGPYVAWPRSLLTNFAAKAGLISLSLDAVP